MRLIIGLLTCAVLANQVAFCSWSSSRQKEHTLSLQNIETKLVSHCTSQIVRDTLAKAEVVFVGEMIRIMPPELPVWSGIMETFQQVEYKVLTLLKGKVNQPDVMVMHQLIYPSLTASKNHADVGLSPEVFINGRQVLLFLGTKEMFVKVGSRTMAEKHYVTLDPNCGVAPAESPLAKIMKGTISSKN